jgi:2-polyprenyl-6-methoxyphenol hydroxylase-like FAD-dependent oxidoreductase
MEKLQPSRPRSVAVVGTGMAGLTTAHLLHQDHERHYQVTLLEKVSLDPFLVSSKGDSARCGIWRRVLFNGWADA